MSPVRLPSSRRKAILRAVYEHNVAIGQPSAPRPPSPPPPHRPRWHRSLVSMLLLAAVGVAYPLLERVPLRLPVEPAASPLALPQPTEDVAPAPAPVAAPQAQIDDALPAPPPSAPPRLVADSAPLAPPRLVMRQSEFDDAPPVLPPWALTQPSTEAGPLTTLSLPMAMTSADDDLPIPTSLARVQPMADDGPPAPTSLTRDQPSTDDARPAPMPPVTTSPRAGADPPAPPLLALAQPPAENSPPAPRSRALAHPRADPVPPPLASLPALPIPDPIALAQGLINVSVPLKDLFGLSVRTIVLDPGHGGRDPGTRGMLGTAEKDITLDVALRLQRLLSRNPDYRVLLTRSDDSTVSLKERVAFANEQRADLLVSLHVNSLPDSALNIVETYHFGPHSDAGALQLAETENQGSQYNVNEFERIVRNMTDTIKLQESAVLAQSIQHSLFVNIKRQNRRVLNAGVKSAPFVVLLGVEAPSVLAELSCISNPEEAKRLRSTAYRDQMAAYLAEGLVNYLDGKSGNGDITHARSKLEERHDEEGR